MLSLSQSALSIPLIKWWKEGMWLNKWVWGFWLDVLDLQQSLTTDNVDTMEPTSEKFISCSHHMQLGSVHSEKGSVHKVFLDSGCFYPLSPLFPKVLDADVGRSGTGIRHGSYIHNLHHISLPELSHTAPSNCRGLGVWSSCVTRKKTKSCVEPLASPYFTPPAKGSYIR